jgi:hypothetical protein
MKEYIFYFRLSCGQGKTQAADQETSHNISDISRECFNYSGNLQLHEFIHNSQ